MSELNDSPVNAVNGSAPPSQEEPVEPIETLAPVPEFAPAAPPPPPAIMLRLVLAFLGLATGYSLMFVAGGELRLFAVAGLEVVPLAILAVLAYAVEERPLWSKALAGGYWMLLVFMVGMAAVGFTLIPFDPELAVDPTPGAGDASWSTENLVLVAVAALAVFLSILTSLCCFLPIVRRVAARFLNIEADAFRHAMALATVTAMTLLCVIPLVVTGEPPLLTLLRIEGEMDLGTPNEQLRSMLYGLVWAVPASFLAVGFPIKRSFTEARERLALVWPTRRQWMASAIVTIALVLSVGQLEKWITAFWEARGWQVTDAEALEVLFGFAIGPVGAIVVGVTAGLGEELAFRGVLQPRLGIVLPALMFTSVHAFQYDFDALLLVFLLGVVFGFIRNKTNTTTCALIHGGYDCVLVLWLYFSGGEPETAAFVLGW